MVLTCTFAGAGEREDEGEGGMHNAEVEPAAGGVGGRVASSGPSALTPGTRCGIT